MVGVLHLRSLLPGRWMWVSGWRLEISTRSEPHEYPALLMPGSLVVLLHLLLPWFPSCSWDVNHAKGPAVVSIALFNISHFGACCRKSMTVGERNPRYRPLMSFPFRATRIASGRSNPSPCRDDYNRRPSGGGLRGRLIRLRSASKERS